MSRLPTPGQDNGIWGSILNDYLDKSHNADGTLKDNTVGSSQVQDGAVTNSKVADASLTSSKLVDATVTGGKIASGTITDTNISSSAAIAPSKISGTALTASNNLSDVTAATARTNLGLGTAATMTPATLAADSAFSGTYVQRSAGFYTLPESARSDAGTAINAAITSFGANGGTIIIPSGDWNLNGVVVAPTSNITIQGAGPASTKLIEYGDIDAIAASEVSHVTIRDLFLVGAQDGVSGSGAGIRLGSTTVPNTYITITNVTIYGFDGNGIDITTAVVSTISGVTATACQTGFYIHGGGFGTSTHIMGCYANACRDTGYNIHQMTYQSMESCAADSNLIGYLLDNCTGVTLSGCGAEQNSTNSLKINSGSGNGVHGFFTYGASGRVIDITGSAVGVVLECVIESTPGGSVINHITVDAGCNVAMIMCKSVTANSLAGGTTTVLV